MRTDTDLTDMEAMSADLSRLVTIHRLDADLLREAGNALGSFAYSLTDETEQALSLHLSADALRMMALAAQTRMTDEHARSVVGAAIRRLDRRLSFAA